MCCTFVFIDVIWMCYCVLISDTSLQWMFVLACYIGAFVGYIFYRVATIDDDLMWCCFIRMEFFIKAWDEWNIWNFLFIKLHVVINWSMFINIPMSFKALWVWFYSVRHTSKRWHVILLFFNLLYNKISFEHCIWIHAYCA